MVRRPLAPRVDGREARRLQEAMADASLPIHPPPSRRSRFAQTGLWAVGLVSVAVTAACTYQILHTTLFPSLTQTNLSCHQGLQGLYDSTQQARRQAAEQVEGERLALQDFRDALEPQWRHWATIRARCQRDADSAALSTLRQIELLRYAEERAVRYDALDLSRLRRTTPRAIQALSSSSAVLSK